MIDDDGSIIMAISLKLPSGSRVTIARPSYFIELSFEPPTRDAFAACTSNISLDSSTSVRPTLGHSSDSRFFTTASALGSLLVP